MVGGETTRGKIVLGPKQLRVKNRGEMTWGRNVLLPVGPRYGNSAQVYGQV